MKRVSGFWAQRQDCGDPEPLRGGSVSFTVGCSGGTGASSGGSSRDQLRTAASWLTGNHELKAGVEYRGLGVSGDWRGPAPFPEPLVADGGVVVDPDGVAGGTFILTQDGLHILLVSEGSNDGATEEMALFVADAWKLQPNLSLNLGARVSSIKPKGGTKRDVSGPLLEFGFDEMIAPRLSVVWDPTRQGRSRLFASAGRYYESIAMGSHMNTFGSDTEFLLHFFLIPGTAHFPVTRTSELISSPLVAGGAGMPSIPVSSRCIPTKPSSVSTTSSGPISLSGSRASTARSRTSSRISPSIWKKAQAGS